MIHKACMPVYMESGKIVADGTGGKIEGSTRGPRGPKNQNFCIQKKSSKIPGKVFRDVDVRPLEQSCLAQHVLSVLRDEQTLTNVDNK